MYGNKETLLKSLHICLKLSIMVFDENFQLDYEYQSDKTFTFLYDFTKIFKSDSNKGKIFYYMTGKFNELFFIYNYKKKRYVFGPFKCLEIDKEIFNSNMRYRNMKLTEREKLFKNLESLPTYSLSDMRDILLMVHYFFTGRIEDLLHEPIHTYVAEVSGAILVEHIDNVLSQNYDPEMYLFLYEKKILKYVASGDVEKLKEMVTKLSNAPMPNSTGDSIRSEKNYSIIVFEKLAQTAIGIGMDLIFAYQMRDSFIKRSELSKTLQDILFIRDSAIVFFTKEIGNVKKKHLSPTVTSITQYIGLNIYKRLTVKEIAEYFSMSESKLRMIFKEEMEITLYKYILEMKIKEGKKMLKKKASVNEVAFALGFSDSSHFSKSFKKVTGTTPKQYQQSIDADLLCNL